MDILSQQFQNIIGFPMTTLAPVLDPDSNTWKCDKKLQPVSIPSAQIHYTGRDHWVLSFQTKETEVCI
jgi:hypothetical protein